MTTENKVILLQQFRTRYPDWVIDSKVIKSDGAIVIQATVLDLDGKVRSSGHGSVAFQSAHFNADLAEQAEDSAIERAIIHLFGGDTAPDQPPAAPPTGDDDDTDSDIDASDSETNVPGEDAKRSDELGASHSKIAVATPVEREPVQPFLAGDPKSKRRVRSEMQHSSPRKFANGTPGVPGISFHRRPTGT